MQPMPANDAAPTPPWHYAVFFGVLGLGLVLGFSRLGSVGVDWEFSFDPAMSNFLDYWDHSSYVGFPWLLFFIPHGLLPLALGNAINLTLNILVPLAVIMRYRGGWQAVALLYTSPFFLDLMRTNNVDWIPLVAFLLPLWAGLPFLVAKPQVLGGAALIWLKKHWRQPLWVLPAALMVLVSVGVWGITEPLAANDTQALYTADWNFAPFPFMVPVGLYLLWKAWQREDAVVGAAATPFLVPYFAPYSLVPLLTLLACTHRRDALYVWVGFWVYFIVSLRRMGGLG